MQSADLTPLETVISVKLAVLSLRCYAAIEGREIDGVQRAFTRLPRTLAG